jgi:3',5'-cyclic-AMP phosphodiesterase
MNIYNINNEPFHALPYRTAASGGGIQYSTFPLLHAEVDQLPDGCAALFVCSDLQGLADIHQPDGVITSMLLGEVLAEELALLAESGTIPPTEQIGILLCGDLFVRPLLDARGGLGDVRPVWRAFARHFRWVAGTPGNHDSFGGASERKAFAAEPGIYLLDGTAMDLDGVQVAGLGGIIGNPEKPNRRDERTFLRTLDQLLREQPEILLLHQGPDAPELRLGGDPRIRQVLEQFPETLVLCGHMHWRQVIATLPGGLQVANLEARGLLLRQKP